MVHGMVRGLRGSIILGAAALLAGCADITATPPGTPLAQVEAQFGPPVLRCTARDGQARVVWTQQPMGQYAWGSDLDAQGRVQHIAQVLTDEHFAKLAEGRWTPEQVRCAFGPPAEVGTVGLPGSREVVWSYRYRQEHVWDSLMYVYFGHDGSHVTRFHPGPDPMYLRREPMGWD